MTPEEVELLKGDMPLKVKGGSDFIALDEGENTYAADARNRDANALDVFEINEDGSLRKKYYSKENKKRQQNTKQ